MSVPVIAVAAAFSVYGSATLSIPASTGASFTAMTLIFTVAPVVAKSVPSAPFQPKLSAPLTFAFGT